MFDKSCNLPWQPVVVVHKHALTKGYCYHAPSWSFSPHSPAQLPPHKAHLPHASPVQLLQTNSSSNYHTPVGTAHLLSSASELILSPELIRTAVNCRKSRRQRPISRGKCQSHITFVMFDTCNIFITTEGNRVT